MTVIRLHSAAATLLVSAALATAVAEDAKPPVGGRLDVAGGSLAGDLVPVAEAGDGVRDTFLWRSPRFAMPFEFRIGEVAGMTFPAPAEVAPAPGPFVHLRGGDAIAGVVESLDDESLVVSTAGPAGPQRLRIARAEVAAITRTAAAVGSYSGPGGLTGWEQTPAGSWREEAGRIMTNRPGASVVRDLGVPARARFDVRVSRRRAAEFIISLAAAERPSEDGYTLQAVGADAALMLVRRSGGRAVIEPLPPEAWRGDTLQVVLFVDQERGRLAVVFPDAVGADAGAVTEATLPPVGEWKPSGRFRLELTGGDLCLERLQASAWRGDEPTLRDGAGTTVVTRGGTLEGFTVRAFDAAAGTYELVRDGETKRVAVADVEEIRFPAGDDALNAAVRVVRADGCALAGDLLKVDDVAVWLRRRGLDAAVAVPRPAIVAIQSLRPTGRPEANGARVGTLLAGEDRVRGRLVAGADGGLAWRPVGSETAAAFSGDVAAEVEYVVRKVEKRNDGVQVGGIGGLVNRDAEGFFAIFMMTEDGAAARDGRIQPGDRILAIAPAPRARFVETKDLDNETVTHLLRGRVGTVVRLKLTDAAGANPREIDLARGAISVAGREVLEQALQAHVQLAGAGEDAAGDPQGDYPALVILRSGDVAPCRIEALDADAVTLRSPLATGSEAAPVRVPAELVKAVELIPSAASRTLDKALLDRLLTLPRMQRDRPPTHLLRMVDGDYLRGRLVKADDKTVTFDVLDVVKELPRGQVARIIWLHPDVPRPDGAPPVEPPAEEGTVVQGVSADGRRMTLVADTVDGNAIRGHSRAFGQSGIDLAHVDRLLIGGAVGRDGRELPFAKWTLKPAPEPRALGKPDGE